MCTLLLLPERVWPGSAHRRVESQPLLMHTLVWLLVTVAALQHPLDGKKSNFTGAPRNATLLR